MRIYEFETTVSQDIINLLGTKMIDYHINVFYSDEDDGYIADIPDLHYCSAYGDSPEEALKEVLIAKELWLEAAQANNKPIPLPKYRPFIYKVAML